MPLIIKLVSSSGSNDSTAAAQKLVASGGHRGRWRLDKLANRVQYKRQLSAIHTIVDTCERARAQLSGTGGDSQGESQKKKEDARPSAAIAAALTARDHGATAASLRTLCERPIAPNAAHAVGHAAASAGLRLNPSQQRAAEAAASGCFTLVQGPPGTGKTAMSLSVILSWLRSGAVGGYGGGSVLATSDSNIACDNLLSGLVSLGVRCVRLGKCDNVRPELLRYCLDSVAFGGRENGADGRGGAAGARGGSERGPRTSEQKQADHLAKMAAIRSAQVTRGPLSHSSLY